MRITKRLIERWGWGVWDGAMHDAEQVAQRGIDSRARQTGRNWIRSLERTRKAMAGEGPQEKGAR